MSKDENNKRGRDMKNEIIDFAVYLTGHDVETVAQMYMDWAEHNHYKEEEPYFGWCDVEGCENEASCGGTCWPDTGYWRACMKHSSDYRDGKPQPQMKQSAIDREERRGADGVLRG